MPTPKARASLSPPHGNDVHLSRYFLEPYIRLLRTKYEIGQQYPGVNRALGKKHGHDTATTVGARDRLRRFLKKNFLIQGVGTGLIKMSYLGNTGWRSKRASTACIAALPSAMPFW